MKEVLWYSLGPIPWSLALPDGGLVKTVKSKLLNVVEVGVETVASAPMGSVVIYDGMVLLQQLDGIQLDTFGEMSQHVLERILKNNAEVIYFVTDQYKADSGKGLERAKRASSGAIHVIIGRPDQKRPQQFKKFLGDPRNKLELVQFILNDWSHPTRYLEKLRNRQIFATMEERCFFIRIENGSIIMSEIGTKQKTRILDITAIKENLGEPVSRCLPALHCFTGCDYTSAFHGIGKAKAYKILQKNERFQEVFALLGDTYDFNEDLFQCLQEFVCIMYGMKKVKDVNEARYLKFCSKKGQIPEPQQLPPTSDELHMHCKRVSYSTAIVKRALESDPMVPSPDGYGWKILPGNNLEADWMTGKPAPQSILELVSCACQKSKCQDLNCVCKSYGLTCTDLCACNKCENSLDVEDNEENFAEIDEVQESDEESWSDATEDDETDFGNYV
eukprot:gene2872-3322_t